ncbi:hypothetical protein FHX34_1085 [Actinoplanes teichomyceticus]|uniref:Uncharacterized protein n=1 Tax=Actinoplanes teichomyceticus TaxID=1867 RepID=A0A561VCF1_ACTTI|nr:hypothetical protein FHX34_1085 [Actinoplanes teichomyceticus]GIF16688.1 hypothetical protein Ate01nite_67200 [Actinoplanes teichomyceticus]
MSVTTSYGRPGTGGPGVTPQRYDQLVAQSRDLVREHGRIRFTSRDDVSDPCTDRRSRGTEAVGTAVVVRLGGPQDESGRQTGPMAPRLTFVSYAT